MRPFSTLALLSFACLAAVGAIDVSKSDVPEAPKQVAPAGMSVDPKHPLSCEKFKVFKQQGKVKPLKTSDKAFYLAPGLGSCNETYTDDDPVVCVNQGWTSHSSLKGSGCGRWVNVTNTATKISAMARISDTCGVVPASTFDCADIYVTKSIFKTLSGDKYKENLDAGNLQAPIDWYFTAATCESCYRGQTSFRPNGEPDLCDRKDGQGFRRCGRKTGKDIITDAAELKKVCNANYHCPKAATL